MHENIGKSNYRGKNGTVHKLHTCFHFSFLSSNKRHKLPSRLYFLQHSCEPRPNSLPTTFSIYSECIKKKMLSNNHLISLSVEYTALLHLVQ